MLNLAAAVALARADMRKSYLCPFLCSKWKIWCAASKARASH